MGYTTSREIPTHSILPVGRRTGYPGRTEASFGEPRMFRASDPERKLSDAAGLMPPEKREECERSWAGPFRQKALPILVRMEMSFAELFDPDMGRPNRPIPLVLGVLILKEMWDLSDNEALEALKFDTRWWYAFDLPLVELTLSQKTLHNFRAKLIEKEKAQLPFRRLTDELIGALGVSVVRQRLDSTHVLSNFAVLTRLGVFCETLRVFLHRLAKEHRDLYDSLPSGILRRHGEDSHYGDAHRKEGPRRLAVVARDVYRLVGRFGDHAAVKAMEEFALVRRLLADQCDLTQEPRSPKDDDDDREDGAVPVELKPARDVKSDSLQTPHDPNVTYSGHKGKGYEVQVAETCTEGNVAQMITDVEVTRACGSDAKATVPVVEALERAGHKPAELVTDTGYSGAQNAADLGAKEVNLLAPAPAAGKPDPDKTYPPPEPKCPTDRDAAAEWLKRQEASPSFLERYAIRAGGEATNSELKRPHGMRKLRVRGEDRVKLAVYFKALACNLKRALRWWLQCMQPAEGGVALG